MREEGSADDGPVLGVAQMLARARFEVVPVTGLHEQVPHLPREATTTVTCSPTRGIERTLEWSARLAAQGFRTVPHIAARLVLDRRHLLDIVQALAASGIDEVFVVGGDARRPLGRFDSAGALLRGMREIGQGPTRIGIAGYPERHPAVDDETLTRALLDKQAFASYVVTQICFDATAVFSWIDAVRGRGVRLPVYVGLPGPLRTRKLLEISMRVGVGDSVRYVAHHGGLVARLVRRGGYRPDRFVAQVSSLAASTGHGLAGFHINTFNQVESAERWRRETLGTYGRSAP